MPDSAGGGRPPRDTVRLRRRMPEVRNPSTRARSAAVSPGPARLAQAVVSPSRATRRAAVTRDWTVMIPTALLLLFGAQAAAQPPLIPAFFTGEKLYRICNRPNGGQCSMYVAGVLDGLFYARSRGGPPTVC